MSDAENIVEFPASQAVDHFVAARERLRSLLIRHTLLDSYDNFVQANKPYPVPSPEALLPGGRVSSAELPYRNTALLVLIDGTLPRALNKHFRLRASNRLTWRNIRRFAPDLEMDDFESSHAHLDSPALESLLKRLLPLDYALLAQRPEDGPDCGLLSHLHVKLERLTDYAIRSLGHELGYIQRSLFERGEDYVEALEAKYYEYYGFAANASGRRSAAAMAAQILRDAGCRFCVFVASAEDGRLTELDDSDIVRQIMLIRPDKARLASFRTAARRCGLDGLDPYTAAETPEGPLLLYRVGLARTAAARPDPSRQRDREIALPWLCIDSEALIPLPDRGAPALPVAWAAGAAEPA